MSHRALGRSLLAVCLAFSQWPAACFARNEAAQSNPVQNINAKDIENIPAGGRNFSDLASLTPQVGNNKASLSDSVNWSQLPLTDGQAKIAQGLGAIPADQIERIEILKDSASSVYGSDAVAGVVNFITKSGSNSPDAHLGSQLQQLPFQREWPGEAVGANGMVAATGRSQGKGKAAVIYDSYGYPLNVYSADDIKNHPGQVMADLNKNCDLISSGKIHVSGKTTVGASISDGFRPSNDVSGYPREYRLAPGFMYKDKGGGMTQIDPPAAPASGPTQQKEAPAPQASILDEISPDTLPGKDHPAPTGDPAATDNKDGSRTRSWPDGTKETTWPDGRQDVAYADGSAFTRGADGTMADTAADGSRVTRDKTGKETGRSPATKPQQPAQSQAPQNQSGNASSGVVNDNTIEDAVNRQKDQKVKDAINQYLTPQPGSKPRSRLNSPRRWLQAMAEFFIESAQAATTQASTTDANGNTTSLSKGSDGITTRTVTDAQGNVLERTTVNPEPITHATPRTPGHASASTTDANGNTVTIEKNPDGTTTRTVTDASGKIIERGPLPKPEPTKVPARTPGTTSASTTDESGNTTTINRNPDGSVTRTVTDASGKITEQGPLTQPPAMKPLPRDPAEPFASTTDSQGNTITLHKLPDGTTAQTITDPSGKVISHGPITPPPATKPQPHKPGTRASTTDADGNTLTVEKLPDGTTIRTITAPDGTVIERTPNQPAKPSPAAENPATSTSAASANTASAVIAQAPIEPAKTTPSSAVSYAGAYGLGLGFKPSYSLGLPFKYSFNDSPTAAKKPKPEEPFTPYIESGVIIGDTVYSNLGTYKVGHHPILDRNKNEQAQMPASGSPLNILPPGSNPGLILNNGDFAATLGGPIIKDRLWFFGSGNRNKALPADTTPTESAPKPLVNPYAYGTTRYGVNPLHSMPQMPQGWTPQMVGILPYGCDSQAKQALYDDIRAILDGRQPTGTHLYDWESVFGRTVQARQESQASGLSPNDPLYSKGSSADKAAMKLPPKTRERMGGPDMSMAAPPEAGPSPIAELGPSHGGQKGPQALDQWGLFASGFTPQGTGRSAWDLVDTSRPNTTVAIIDSGLDLSHPDGPQYPWTNPGEIAGNGIDDDGDGYVDDAHGWNFNDENDDLTDYKGHGTLIAGIIAAKRNNGIGVAGINPGAQIMALKVTDKFGKTDSLAIFRAIHYAVKHGARVINISLGDAGVSKLEQLAINYAHAHGAVIVVAAGNQSTNAAQIGPAAARRAITVAAVNMDRAHNKLSNEGAPIALAAPGENIYSLQSKDAEWTGSAIERDRQYRTATGTSFSAPMVAATASLILAKQPNLPNVLVEDMLLDSARPSGEGAWNDSTGWGLLNAADALSLDAGRIITIWPNEVVADKSGLRIFGTIRGVFSAYRVEIGKGRKPREWQPVGNPSAKPVTQGLIVRIPSEQLKGIKDGVVRITAQSASGAKKVAEVPIRL